jgi:hypothetical protein
MPTSQYQISKSKREVKRLRGLLADAEQRHAANLARGAMGSAEETAARVADLQATIRAEVEWQDQVQVTKFRDWSPARLARHNAKHA